MVGEAKIETKRGVVGGLEARVEAVEEHVTDVGEGGGGVASLIKARPEKGI